MHGCTTGVPALKDVSFPHTFSEEDPLHSLQSVHTQTPWILMFHSCWSKSACSLWKSMRATDPCLALIACKRSIGIIIDGTLVIKPWDAHPGFYLDVLARCGLRGVCFRALTLIHPQFNQCITNYSLDTVIRSFLWAASYWVCLTWFLFFPISLLHCIPYSFN